MSNTVLIAAGAVEVIRSSPIVDVHGSPLTGLTNIKLSVVRDSDGKLLDFADNTFKSAPGSLHATMVELDAVRLPGVYAYSLNTGSFVSPAANDKYGIYISQQGGSDAANALQNGALRVSLVDTITNNLDVAVSTLATSAGLTSAIAPLATSAGLTAAVAPLATSAGLTSAVAPLATSAGLTAAVAPLSTSAALTTAHDDLSTKILAVPAGVWATTEGGAAGTALYNLTLSRKFLTNRLIENVDSTVVLYDDNATTPLKTWHVYDGTGGIVTTQTGEPARREAAT